ncbi:DNA-directed RNA polymerase I subunit rpa49 [Cannabis sativa]|uniref:DNA-directed RNA polymerase I subunit rpa49 n=1 Tax=Cannabis sativa TaxID=3483 RepID=UPI0029CA9B50|nr:DNA-directed RNA polymerase I subunit rpa49 [Cannabis sativa]XP_060971886.1 DNA-directed RNA polymerase I subunit rpa49 [Cannabis sativa]
MDSDLSPSMVNHLEHTSMVTDLSLSPKNEDKKEKKKKKKKQKKEEKEKSQELSVQATVEMVKEQTDKLAPLVGYFPSGFDPNKDPSSTITRVFRNKDKPKRLELVVTPNATSKVDFVGTNYSGEAAAGQHCSYALGVLDKETQTLKIVPIASNKIFRLEPKIRGLVGQKSEQTEPSKLKSEQMEELTNHYGTIRSRREAEKLRVLHKEHDPSSQRDLLGTINQIAVKKEDIGSSEVHGSRNTPPYNSAAATPQEAYPLEKIIFEGEWDFLLEDIYDLLQTETEVTWDAYPTFVANRIHKLHEIKDEEEKKRLSCVFSYITHLVKFKDKHSMDHFSSAKKHRLPRIILQKFSSMFEDPDSHKLSPDKHSLLISYVLVLTLHADGFRANLTDIAKDLKLDTGTLREHYEHLGCKLVRDKKTLVATLPTPLKFPSMRQKRRQ